MIRTRSKLAARTRAGFTLIELMVVMLVTIILMTIVVVVTGRLRGTARPRLRRCRVRDGRWANQRRSSDVHRCRGSGCGTSPRRSRSSRVKRRSLVSAIGYP